MSRSFLSLSLILALASPALAEGVTSGVLTISDPVIPLAPAGAKAAAGYFTVQNSGSTPDRLIGVETAAAQMAMLHLSSVSASGMASMSPVPAGEVPAGGTLVLAPGGMHLMLMGLKAPLAPGETIEAVLVFETAGRVPVRFTVAPAPGAGGN